MSAPVKKCEVTPLEALQRLIGAASVIDASECKDEVVYNVLQSELAVAKEVAKSLAVSPVVPVAAQPVVAAWKPTAIADEVLEESASIATEMMGWDLDHDGEKQMQKFSCLLLTSIAKLTTGTPQIAAPSLEAQPAGEVIPAEKLCALLPGPYYMDPPDGGSVTVLGQVERMAKDAARYQWLCKTAFDSSMTQEQINKEVDASMAQGEKQ